MKGLEIIELSQSEAEPLVLAATGKPYFLLVDVENDEFLSNVKEGFDLGHVFEWLANYARENKEFKTALTDFVIDLSKEC